MPAGCSSVNFGVRVIARHYGACVLVWPGRGDRRVTSIERTAYPQFKRLTSARVLHVFFTPSEDEAAWARERTETPASQAIRQARSGQRDASG